MTRTCRQALSMNRRRGQLLGGQTESVAFISDIAVFVLKRDVKHQPTNQPSVC